MDCKIRIIDHIVKRSLYCKFVSMFQDPLNMLTKRSRELLLVGHPRYLRMALAHTVRDYAHVGCWIILSFLRSVIINTSFTHVSKSMQCSQLLYFTSNCWILVRLAQVGQDGATRAFFSQCLYFQSFTYGNTFFHNFVNVA